MFVHVDQFIFEDNFPQPKRIDWLPDQLDYCLFTYSVEMEGYNIALEWPRFLDKLCLFYGDYKESSPARWQLLENPIIAQ